MGSFQRQGHLVGRAVPHAGVRAGRGRAVRRSLPYGGSSGGSIARPADARRGDAGEAGLCHGLSRCPAGWIHQTSAQRGPPGPDRRGEVDEYIGTTTDITERVQAEAALLARQEMLDLAQKAARAVAFEWRIGAGEGENRWSPDLEAMYGLAPGTYDGTFEAWKELVHPEDWPAVKDAIARANESGDIAAEYRVVHPDGAVRWLQAKGRMFFDDEGQPARVVGFMLDVTERRQAEEELRRLESGCARRSASRRWARWPEALRTTSTTFSARYSGTARGRCASAPRDSRLAAGPGKHHRGRRARSRAGGSHSHVQPQRRGRTDRGARGRGGSRGARPGRREIAPRASRSRRSCRRAAPRCRAIRRRCTRS